LIEPETLEFTKKICDSFIAAKVKNLYLMLDG